MNFLIDKALKKFQRIVLDASYRRTTPVNYCGEDIYLVSYPKSGNTWLRFLIANLLKTHFEIDRAVNFFSIHELIPDIHTSRYLRDSGYFAEFNLPRIIKSHANYNPYYNRVILLVRDPRDVCVSYYYFLQQRGTIPSSWTVSDFIRNKKYGVTAWVKHSQSWYRLLHDRQIVQVFRYEDLLTEPEAQLAKIADLLGIHITAESIKQAIEWASKSAMKHSENTHLSSYLIEHRSMEFVRQAKANRGKELSPDDKRYIDNLTKDIASKLGYDYRENI
jgi:hypothetical protein